MNTSIYTTRRPPVELNRCRQLLLDDWIVEEQQGLTRQLHPPRKSGPVLVPEPGTDQVSLQSRSVPQWNPEQQRWEWWYWCNWECEPYGPYASTTIGLTHYAVVSFRFAVGSQVVYCHMGF